MILIIGLLYVLASKVDFSIIGKYPNILGGIMTSLCSSTVKKDLLPHPSLESPKTDQDRAEIY